MLKESNISPNEIRSRSGPPSRLAATQEPERNAVLKPATAVNLAESPSHTAGMTIRPGSASTARRRAGAVATGAVMDILRSWLSSRDDISRAGVGRRKAGNLDDGLCLFWR